LTALNVQAGTVAFVGDSVTDIEAAHSTGTMSIGYANKPGKGERLTAAGADALASHMINLVTLI
jgi:phosphoglycolate phosphatase-like HAD superfamily hydrolase